MGQKVSPHGLRVGVIKDWNSKWYADKKDFADYLVEDRKIREYIKKRIFAAGISKILIDRAANNQVTVAVLAAKPGMIIGRSGTGIDELKAEVEKLTGKTTIMNIIEVRRSETDAQLTAESIAQALEKRISFRRAMKQAIGRTMKAGAKGIKVVVSGRLGGAEIARSEKYSEGNVPLHTLRSDISYGFAESDTQYGKIGVKVWINNGEILSKELQSPLPDESAKNDGDRRRKPGDKRRRDERTGREGERPPRHGDYRRDDRPEMPKAVNPRKRNKPVERPVKPEPAENPETSETVPEE
ncbi:MAG TPA: 30S ribosomal protein S3 [Bacillota bacterium]|nr:30S ribosomal protein S3 [Bacillota bacterium]